MEPKAANGGKKLLGGKGKLAQFVRKNKALSAVIAAVGGYVAYKELHKGNSEEVIEGSVVGQGSGTPNGEYTPLDPEQEVVAGEPGEPGEPGEEGPEGPPGEEAPAPEGGEGGVGGESPEHVPNEITPVAAANKPGLTVNGKFFQNATGKTIVGSGESAGNKKWIEYRIDFPGSSQRWRYFPATGNWSKATDSKAGPTGSGQDSSKGNGAANKAGGGGGNPNPPQNNPSHPDAVNTGNQCINGGVGPHTAPNGYHLFCDNGWIWRAKDAETPGSAGSAGPPKPPPPVNVGGGGGGGGGNSNCPAGTVANIQHARNERDRLQDEINTINNNISAHPNAKERGAWEANREGKKQKRDEFQGAIDRGRQQPGCGNV